jgi:hypothetical protein
MNRKVSGMMLTIGGAALITARPQKNNNAADDE